MTTTILTNLTEIEPGALIDLEDDPYANFISPHFTATHSEMEVATIERRVESLRLEYAAFDRIEREVGKHEGGTPFDQAVVYTDLTTFACPLDHRLRVVVPGEEA